MIDFEKEKAKALEHLLEVVDECLEQNHQLNQKLIKAKNTFDHFEYGLGNPAFPLEPEEHTFEAVLEVFEKDQA